MKRQQQNFKPLTPTTEEMQSQTIKEVVKEYVEELIKNNSKNLPDPKRERVNTQDDVENRRLSFLQTTLKPIGYGKPAQSQSPTLGTNRPKRVRRIYQLYGADLSKSQIQDRQSEEVVT